MNIFVSIRRNWIKFRLQPIRVFCLHHVCEHFDAESMHEGDWMALSEFKQKVLAMQQRGVQFISLSDAHNALVHSLSPLAFRLKKYAVLTFDDGYASLKEVLPWLKEKGIPVTLFINPDYAAGSAYRESPKEQYLTLEELAELDVEIGMHGHGHLDATKMTETEFEQNVILCKSELERHPRFIPYWAYTWGRHNKLTDAILRKNEIVPVLISGQKNYIYSGYIDRECFDGE